MNMRFQDPASVMRMGICQEYGFMAVPEDMFMRYMPAVLVWGALPAPRMWLWARKGQLSTGDQAPDFTLPLHKQAGTVTLSSFRGQRPVVLVFGSYT